MALGDLMANVEADGITGVFISLTDLLDSLGHLGDPVHLAMRNVIDDAIRCI